MVRLGGKNLLAQANSANLHVGGEHSAHYQQCLGFCWTTEWELICFPNYLHIVHLQPQMRGERQAGELSFIMSPLRQGCVETTECRHMQRRNCLHISKWDIRLIVIIVKETTGEVLTLESCTPCSHGGCPVPEPIIVREADTVHGLDESLSCHVSVSHSDCWKANYRWLNVPFFSAFWCAARPYTELKGRNMVCQMQAATNCSAQIPPFSLGDHSHPPLLKIHGWRYWLQ